MSAVATLRAELRIDSSHVATVAPRLSWVVATDEERWVQASAELSDGINTVVLDTRESVLVEWPFSPLTPGEHREVTVTVTATSGTVTATSAPLAVDCVVLAEWRAAPIALADPPTDAAPALLRREFILDREVRRVLLRSTAIGVFDLEVNGVAADDAVLSPGWTAYRDRVTLETTDVTALVTPGVNALGAWLAGGWATEKYGFFEYARRVYRDQPCFAAQIEIDYADGTTDTIVTDEHWRGASGPLVSSGIYAGEHFDARLDCPGFSRAGFDDSAWSPVAVLDDVLAPDPRIAEPVRRTQEMPVAEVVRTPSGALVLDFGQNLVGRLRIRVEGERGQRITIRHAEVLEDGELSLRPLRNAAATATYDLAGGGSEEWEPRFTFFGFRYAQLDGWPGEFDPASVVAVVLGSDMRRTGWFESSDPLLNRLHENVVWGLRGNFLSVPTDCPQRDERLGWTGDLQVFAPAASFLYDCDGFLTSWLRDLALEQSHTGGIVPLVVPSVLGDIGGPGAIAAWGDAATVVPWVMWQRFGNLQVLRDQFESMRGWVDAVLEQSTAHLWSGTMQLGDWLDPAAPPDQPGAGKTDGDIVATAYLAKSLRIVADSAALLELDEIAAHYDAAAERVRLAFVSEYVTPSGRMMSDAVTAYSLALQFELVTDDSLRAALGNRLRDLVRASGYRVATGFVGTPLVCDALTSTGHVDAAERLLLQTENPSWLYPVTMGATTIWERWDSLLEDGSVNPGEMTSFNHYAFGAVADWMHRTVAGLAPESPGYSTLRISPRPFTGLDSASATHLTPYGEASVSWERVGTEVVVRATVPPNSDAVVSLPGRETRVGSGVHEWRYAENVAPAVHVPLDLDSSTAAIIDEPRAYSAIVEALRAHDPALADNFRRTTVWAERRRLREAFMFTPKTVIDEVALALSSLEY